MKRVTSIAVVLMLSFAVSSVAQSPSAGRKPGLATSLKEVYATMKKSLTQAAEKMPAADYGFKPAPAPTLKTYAQVIGHQVDHQFTHCATIKGVPIPSEGNEKKATKAELVKALADAFAFCDGAFSALTDQTALQIVTHEASEGETARGAEAARVVAHARESYGIATVYLHAKGL